MGGMIRHDGENNVTPNKTMNNPTFPETVRKGPVVVKTGSYRHTYRV
jgi:hypothetical protein